MKTTEVRENMTVPPEVLLDVPLTLRRGYSLPIGKDGMRGPKTGITMDLTEAHAHAWKFDEYGRIEELWERRNAMAATWVQKKDRATDPLPDIKKLLAAWEIEDEERRKATASARAANPQAADLLGAGPVVLKGQKYRDPFPGEYVPPAMKSVVEKAAANDLAQSGLASQLIEAFRAVAEAARSGQKPAEAKPADAKKVVA